MKEEIIGKAEKQLDRLRSALKLLCLFVANE
jgi:hypothetical protein